MFHQSITVANATAIFTCLPIPGHPGYFADDLGNIYTNKRGKLKKLIPALDRSNGYLKVNIYEQGRRRNRYVHHLIALTFIGERPAGLLVCHNPDPRKTNNRAENLVYQTRLDNAADSIRDGTLPRARRKLDYSKAEAIRALHDDGVSTVEIARRYDVSTDCIQKVISWRSWRGQKP
ncbi:HNH endonuclease [Novosphingobium sp. 9U]|uniref:HNH endonuclease n=1 Tax=Novosphingobium sp. 9U TaxID=2653158 RepID=UPI0012F0479B|nr:HNH endonuclease [Novosphingobium sp. 9U]VWX51803.1 conserved hypothetical protein [Novosphingobium sp. 9U]